MPTPAPELANLKYFEGRWISEGEFEPSALGAAGQMTMTEDNQWMEGGFFLILRSRFTITSQGSGSGIGFMGYDALRHAYTYDEFNSMGETEHSIGTLDADTWTWSRNLYLDGKTLQARFIMKMLSSTAYVFCFEMSSDGNSWSTAMRGRATKA